MKICNCIEAVWTPKQAFPCFPCLFVWQTVCLVSPSVVYGLQGAGHSYPPNDSLRKELVAAVRKSIGPIATPDTIHWAPGMPKTRSGKIMRRILRKIANK